jgi:hypothetical protein
MRRKAKAESGEDGKNSGGQRKTATAKATDHKEKFETKFPTAQLAPHI